MLFLRGLPLAQLTLQRVPLGISRSPDVCPSASLVTWVGHQPFPSFSVLLLLPLACRGSLGSARLHPVSGCFSWGGVCSLDDSGVTLLAFSYLRVGGLLGCGVYCVSWLRSLRSRLPFGVRPPFNVSVCPSPALGLGWLVTGL